MQIDLSRFRETFFEEAAEHLAEMESGLLRLEYAPDDKDLLNTIFRAAHSIKGASGTFGFNDITSLTHVMESQLDRMRDGTVRPAKGLISLLLRASDALAGLVAAAKADQPSPPGFKEVAAELRRALQSPGSAAEAPAPAATQAPTGEAVEYRVHFAPDRDLLRQGMDPLLLLRDLAALGEVTGVKADLDNLPDLAELDPEGCYLAWTLTLHTGRPPSDLDEVFAFVKDTCRVQIDRVSRAGGEPIKAAPEAEGPGPAAAAQGPRLDSASIRVPVDKVDKLVNLVEELVVAQSMLNQVATNFTPERLPYLQEAVSTMERNLRELQERVMAVRMVPIGSTTGRFPRVVRELAASLGKKVNFEMVGQETELDKQVIERIGDPLIHLIRNAVDHGVEPPAERRAAGKREEGTVRLTAFHQGDNVVIEVADDGRGLDARRLREKGVAQGLLRPDQEYSEAEIQGLIFHPGFSTAAAVSDVSGRGVGMDVVKRNVEALNGSVSLHSRPGQGTRTRIKLPLTLAILDGFCLGLKDDIYILPLLSIVESLQPRPEHLKTVLGKGEVVLVRGEALPLFRLYRLLNARASVTAPSQGLVVIVESDGEKFGLLVDEVLGQSQVVIKNLEANYRKVEGIAGATILGDGRVALILDVHGLARLATARAAPPAEPARQENEAALAVSA